MIFPGDLLFSSRRASQSSWAFPSGGRSFLNLGRPVSEDPSGNEAPEHFAANRTPVRVAKMRQNKNLERRAAAIDWWVRHGAGPLDEAERSAFEAWLARDPANRSALDEICGLWGDLGHLRGRLPLPAPRSRWQGIGPRLAAATCLLAMAVLVAVLAFDPLSLLWLADHRTGTGEVEVVTLEDGTRVELNAQSAIAVDFSARGRDVRLLAGEAWFEVARDPARPFNVAAGGGTITALGTAFDVATDRDKTEVTVTEHRVRVVSGGETAIVPAGQQTAYGPKYALLAPHAVDAAGATAWRRGKLIFEDKPLGDVLASLGKYHRGFVLVIDSRLRDRRVSGVFATDNPLGAIRAIVTSLGLRATTLTDYLILLRS